MLLERKEIKRENDKITIIESIYDSSNIVKTNYIPERNHMFIFFKNKLVYSYSNIDKELYDKFEMAESQGVFFRNEIRSNPKSYNFIREYKLYDFEIQDIIKQIGDLKNAQEDVMNGDNMADMPSDQNI
jgi:KTSC domain